MIKSNYLATAILALPLAIGGTASDGNKAVWVVDYGPPMTNDEWVEKFCTPD